MANENEGKYIKCLKCGWWHFFDDTHPHDPWVCFRCGNADRTMMRRSDEYDGPIGVTLQGINRGPMKKSSEENK